MSTFSLKDCTIWGHGYDFTTDSNKLAIATEVNDLDDTTFGDSYRSRVGGLRSVEAELAGFWQSATSGAVDLEAFPDLGTANRVWTASPTGATETSVAYMFQAGKFGVEMFGEVGELAPFTLNLMGTNGVGVVRGQVAKGRGNVSATGVLGSVLSITGPTSTQFAYCTVHIFSAGTTITLQLQSDTASNFPSATTQATIGPLTVTGGTWMTRVAGPLSGENFWRLNVSSITGTFNIAAAVGVQ